MNSNKNKFLHWLKTPYLIIIRSEDNLEVKTTLRFRKSDLIVIGLLIFLILQSLSLFLTYKVRKAWINPRYAEFQTHKQLLDISERVDSLTLESELMENYYKSLKKVIAGKDVSVRTNPNETNDKPATPRNLDSISATDSIVRKQFESEI